MPWNSQNRTYREFGAFRFTRAQRESYALILDIEILSVVRESYVNFKGNPPYGFWGVATVFQGQVPIRRKTQEWVRTRVINRRNEFVGQTFNDKIADLKLNTFQTDVASALDYVVSELLEFPQTPLLEHPDSIVKFRGLPSSQFKFTCYWLPFPDTGANVLDFTDRDPTRDFDGYPEPAINPADDPYLGQPTPNTPPSNLDERDFSPENTPSGFIGTLTYEFSANNAAFQPGEPKEGVSWPGQIVTATDSEWQYQFLWEDEEGVRTLLTRTNFPPHSIRFVQIETDNGEIFVPDPNTLTNP